MSGFGRIIPSQTSSKSIQVGFDKHFYPDKWGGGIIGIILAILIHMRIAELTVMRMCDTECRTYMIKIIEVGPQ